MEACLTMLEDVGNKIEISAFNGILNLTPYMVGLLVLLATIAIATEWDMYFSNTWNWGNLITKIIHIGMIAFFIRNWTYILSMVKGSAEKLGMLAGGSNVAYTPTKLLKDSLNAVYSSFHVLWDNFSFTSGHVLIYIFAAVALVIALFAIFRISFVIFMANAEFLILGALSIVLLPFGVTKWTSSISDKTWGILLTSAVKLMVAIFMISMIGSEIQSAFKVNAGGTITEKDLPSFITSAFALLFLSFLCAQAVEFAGAMTTGVMINSNNIIHSVPSAYFGARNTAGAVGTLAKSPYTIATAPVKGARWAKNAGGTLARTARHPVRALKGWWQK